MGTTFIEGVAVRPGRTPKATAHDSIAYITNPKKTKSGELVTSYHCSPETAHLEMLMVQKEYEQQTGRKVIQDYGGKKQSYLLMTMRQSFSPGEVDEKTAHEIGCKLAESFLGSKYQYVVATHINSHCIHNHITFNIVGDDMKKFHQTMFTPKRLAEVSDKLCKEYGLAVVVPSQDRQKRTYSREKATSFRTILKNDIDRCISKSESYEDFIKQMSTDYYVKTSGKYLTFCHKSNGQQRNIRAYTLGEDYKEKNIKARISHEKAEPVPVFEGSNKDISFSQHLRNIQSMFTTSGLLNEYDIKSYRDIKNLIDSITDKADTVRQQLQTLEQNLSHSNDILDSLNALEKFKDLAAEYDSSLLKDRFYQQHREELDLYLNAKETLAQNGMSTVSSAENENFSHSFSESQQQFDNLQTEFDMLQDKLSEVNQMKRIIDKVHTNEVIITERKGGHPYDR